MSASTTARSEHIEQFLNTLRIRRRTVPKYVSVLKRYERLALKDADDKPPSLRMLCRWARRQRTSPLYMIHSRARLIDRYLTWRTKRGTLARNPFEQLRQQYYLHSMTPIVAALLSTNPRRVLLHVRGCPPFASFLGPQMQAHIARMRVLGCRYHVAEAAFLRFDRFLQTRPDLKGQSLQALVGAWSRTHTNLRHVFEAQRCGRWLSKSLHRLDPTVPLLSIDIDLSRQVRRLERRPSIYSEEERSRQRKPSLRRSRPCAQ